MIERFLKQIQQTVCNKNEYTEKPHFVKGVFGKQLFPFLLFKKELDGREKEGKTNGA
ncbi:hypothetical protein HU147_13370 [Planomicrobium chinense]|uniref:hypothetical protein n=1 Tax=Planococcus chinensis TaxID=272917 RepID=UPI001CC6DA7F|nr:hypothetical protein [Planococcus chinensis]MBZ5202212.1 hypothetical protein [Planococcus chinensis]